MRAHLATLVEDFRRYPREIAVVRYQGNRRRVATYGQIAHLAGRFAAFLEQQNIGLGDRVLLWAENSAEWIAAFHGCMLRGAIAVPLDAYGNSAFAIRVAADVQPKLAVGDVLLLRQLPQDDARFTFPLLSFEDWPNALPVQEAGPIAGLNHGTPLQILFTSGTTGDPKGIVHTHGNVLASVGPIEEGAQRYLRYEKFVHPLRFLHTLPLSHVFGQTMGLWIPPILRAELHFESRLVAPRLIEIIRRERISVLAAVPRVFALLKTHLESTQPALAERVAASHGMRAWKRWWSFRGIHRAFGFKFWALISGGGALPAAVEQFWNALGFVVIQGYGMTETTALITLNHPFHVARGTIGKPLPGREVKIGPDGEVLVRGPMISTSTWSGGALRQRESEWLATGDLAEAQTTGELRFLGRKSEVIVTAAGLNIHPEDLEAAIEQQPGVAACAVVGVETPAGPEPCAVLAMRGGFEQADAAINRANAELADFQRVHRWVIWPEPDLPRTSTGKVKRQAVSAWLAATQAASAGTPLDAVPFASTDWLMTLIAQIGGEVPRHTGDEVRLAEDLHLDSLGRVQLAAAIEEKLGMPPESGLLDQAQTLGDLRALISGAPQSPSRKAAVSTHDTPELSTLPPSPKTNEPNFAIADNLESDGAGSFTPRINSTNSMRASAPDVPEIASSATSARPHSPASQPIYPHWPWRQPIVAMRNLFIEIIMRPLVWLLANPRIVGSASDAESASMLIVANHVTAYDGPLIQYALPGPMRRHIAAAMSGEMLEDFRRARNPQPGARHGRFFPFGPIAYFLVTALFNVFPLPRLRDFQRSFVHAGEALDHGYNVLIFPEGTRSEAGQLARFRPGIGLLVKQSSAPVLPIAIRGLGELKARGRGWFRSGKLEVRIGRPIRFLPEEMESAITERLHEEVKTLLHD